MNRVGHEPCFINWGLPCTRTFVITLTFDFWVIVDHSARESSAGPFLDFMSLPACGIDTALRTYPSLAKITALINPFQHFGSKQPLGVRDIASH